MEKKRRETETEFYADTLEWEKRSAALSALNRERGMFIGAFETGLNRERGVFHKTAVFAEKREE